MADTISWIATVATIIAASMTAANLGSRITGYGFCVFLVGSLSWLATGLLTQQPALVWTNAVLTILNIFGIWRWLGRQARIEQGASSASEESEQWPGETLFPVSLLLKAPLEDGAGKTLGTCVDAMAGCTTGKLRYVVASQGGLAGLGETLRRVPWSAGTVESACVVTNLDEQSFEDLEIIEKDEWPVR
jgi:hypothetical protein